MNRRQRVSEQSGFTLVEVLVTIIVATLFVVTISQLTTAQSKVTSNVNAYNTADLLAYNNLRTYAYGKAPTWFDCNYTGANPDAMTLIAKTDPVAGLPAPVTQSVIATAPYGCGGGSSGIGYPIKVVSTVTYGPSAKVVVHATYATY